MGRVGSGAREALSADKMWGSLAIGSNFHHNLNPLHSPSATSSVVYPPGVLLASQKQGLHPLGEIYGYRGVGDIDAGRSGLLCLIHKPAHNSQ